MLRELSSASVWFNTIDVNVEFEENNFDCWNGHG